MVWCHPFFIGVLLFSIILIYFLFHISQIGFRKSYFDSVVDISYFIFSAPFLMFSLQIKTNRKSIDSIVVKND